MRPRSCLLPLLLAPFTLTPVRAQVTDQLNYQPEVDSAQSCRIEEVLPRVTLHVKEIVDNVNRFTATEFLERERLNHRGDLKEKAHSRSNYVATIEETKPGIFVVREYRFGTQGLQNFDGTIQANVAPALVLIFHPSHIGEFAMTCVGRREWHQHSTWQVHFEQRMDQPATMADFEVGGGEFTILLKGSAWIDTNSYEILHLETDLLKPIPEIQLDTLHQSVDYGPVKFPQRDTTLWLPQFAD
ncbi:MAG: hypothetical protein WBS21_07315, partial [Candidatus Acidiferrum sp.]